MKKRLLAWILALVMIVSLLPAAVLATGAETLAEMVYAAAANATITLGKGTYTIPSGVESGETVPSGLTIVGAGADKTTVTVQGITPGESSASYFFDGEKAVTFKNVTIDFGPATDFDGFVRAGDMTFENVTIKGMGSHWGKGNVTFTNCSFVYPDEGYNEWTYNLWTYSGSSFTFNNCTFHSKLGGGSEASPARGKFVNVYNQAKEGTVSVSLDTCTFVTVKEDGTTVKANKPVIKIGTGSAWNISLTDIDITEAEAAVDATTGSKLYGDSGISNKPSTSVTINGATVWANGQAYAAMIGTAQYASLAEAITAAQNGDTIKLLKDVTENVTIPKGKTLTLDLNGKTLSGGTTAGKPALLNNGTVTIKDSSEAQTGKICRKDNGAPGYYTIDNQGTMTIESGSVYNNTGTMPRGSSLIRNAGRETAATLIINGGDIKQDGFIAVKNDDHGILIINGGTITTTGDTDTNTASAVQNWAQATINGGTINGTIWTSVWDNNLPSSVTTIKNAKVTGKIIVKPNSSGLTVIPTLKIEGGDFTVTGWDVQDNGVVSISGGTFNVDPTDYLADGYIVKKLDDGTWGVSEKEPEFPSWITALPALDGSKKLPFTDVWRGDWYYDGVRYVFDNDLMNGTSGTVFSPNAATTRGMIVTILARMDGVNTSGTPWYEAGREWAMRNGISDGTNMEGKITREQLAAMLSRYAALKNRDVSAIASISAYADASSVSNWAVNAMRWAVGEGLIQGSNNHLRPQSNATRAEVATILMRFCELLKK